METMLLTNEDVTILGMFVKVRAYDLLQYFACYPSVPSSTQWYQPLCVLNHGTVQLTQQASTLTIQPKGYPGELEALEARVDKWGKRFHQAKCQIMEM